MSDQEVVVKVEASLDKIRPFLEADGGDVRVLELTNERVLRLELVGACKECAMNKMTFTAGIEENIKRDVPEVTKVVAVNL